MADENIPPKQVKELRQSLKMSQQEFAQTLGVGVATVSRWETGEARPTGTAAVVIGAALAGATAPLLSSAGAFGAASLGLATSPVGAVTGIAAWGLYRLLKKAFEGDPANEKLAVEQSKKIKKK